MVRSLNSVKWVCADQTGRRSGRQAAQVRMKGEPSVKLLSLRAVLLLLLAAAPVYADLQPVDNGLVAPDQAPSLAEAEPQAAVPIGGLWQEFMFRRAGEPAEACTTSCFPSPGGNSEYAPSPPWSFSAPCGGVQLTVVDAFSSGDIFEVFDFGVSLGTTSSVATGHYGGADPAICVLDPLMSSGVFNLGPGSHSITIIPTASPYNVGAAYFRTDAGAGDDDGDGVCNGEDLCADTSIPEGVPTIYLGVNRWALVDGDGYFDTTLPPGIGPEHRYSILDTAGCSCEQIVAEMGLGAGHTKYGCSASTMDAWIAWID